MAINQTYKLEVNKLARKKRHSRVFNRVEILKLYYSKLKIYFETGIDHAYRFCDRVYVISRIPSFLDRLSMSTQSRLARHISVGAVILFIVTSITPYAGVSIHSVMDSPYYQDGYLIADQDGYLTKFNPQTLEGDRTTMTDRVVHTVASGETVSGIAEKYGLKSETLLWENNIYNQNSIRIGQKLVIPPVNGVTHKVAVGETLDKIATRYKVEKTEIIKQNQLDGDLIAKGQELFIPGGRSIASPVYDGRTGISRSGTAGRYIANPGLTGSSVAPVAGRSMIYPTRGKVSQGWRWGHYAIDIADTSKPPVWAAVGGVVEKASSGWNGGYGNHVVIDHGNGLKTLYAHLEYYSVQPGQTISQGQVIGRMGRTGRVYGRTGIHLHFEVILNGIKQYPANYW